MVQNRSFRKFVIYDVYFSGAKVIWAARDAAKAHNILNDITWTNNHGARGYVLQIDLASKKSIENFVAEFKKRQS